MTTRSRNRRVKEIYHGLLARLGSDADLIAQRDATEVAELQIICEDLRGELNKPTYPKARAAQFINLAKLTAVKNRARRALLDTVPAKEKARNGQKNH